MSKRALWSKATSEGESITDPQCVSALKNCTDVRKQLPAFDFLMQLLLGLDNHVTKISWLQNSQWTEIIWIDCWCRALGNGHFALLPFLRHRHVSKYWAH